MQGVQTQLKQLSSHTPVHLLGTYYTQDTMPACSRLLILLTLLGRQVSLFHVSSEGPNQHAQGCSVASGGVSGNPCPCSFIPHSAQLVRFSQPGLNLGPHSELSPFSPFGCGHAFNHHMARSPHSLRILGQVSL